MNTAPLLLADASPCLRWRVLRELLGRQADDPEVIELQSSRAADPLLVGLLNLQEADGAWRRGVMGDPLGGGALQSTGVALARLAFLGLDRSHEAVQRAADYLFSQQQPDGSWPLLRQVADGLDDGGADSGAAGDEGYAMIPHQVCFPLRGLAACGYAEDERCERAYEWLLAQRLADGAWPTGLARSGVYGYVAGYRRLAHSRWGCRSNTTHALACLAQHPQRRSSPAARRALDLLLGRETRERQALGFEAARLAGAERARGFTTFFARFDLAFILYLSWCAGATCEDERVAEMVDFVRDQRGPYGLWEYQPRPQASRWITLDLLRTLAGLDAAGQNPSDWVSQEPRTPFQPYPKPKKRY